MSAPVTSVTGILPMRPNAKRSKLLSHALGYFGLLHPAFCCSTTLSAASAKLGTPCARRFSASGSPPWPREALATPVAGAQPVLRQPVGRYRFAIVLRTWSALRASAAASLSVSSTSTISCSPPSPSLHGTPR